jgi:hypothetical protein
LITLAATSAASAQNLALELYTVRDPVAVNQEAVTFLKPTGWRVEGGMKWYVDYEHQASLETRVFNPKGLDQIEYLPGLHCTWMTNSLQPPWSNYLGRVVLPPIDDPKEAVRRFILPRRRSGYNARITTAQELPEAARALAALHGGAHVRSARIRAEYVMGGQMVEEDFYVSLYVTAANLGVNNTVCIHWGPAWPTFALRAKKGELDAATPLLLAVANSTRLNPLWFAEYSFVRDLFLQRLANGSSNGLVVSDHIRRNGEAIFKMYSESYRRRQASQDRLARQFSNYIRGLELWHSPFQQSPVQLPSGYRYAWANPLGGYALSNDASFNPNVSQTSTSWQLLKSAK